MAKKSIRRLLLIVPLALVMMLAAAAVVAVSVFDSDATKARITTAFEQRTGRKLTITGDLHLSLFPVPALAADGVTLANLPDGSRPDMVTARRVTARLGWLPLLSRQVAITDLILEDPDLLLERDAAGKPNWDLQQVLPKETSTVAAALTGPPEPRRSPVVVQGLRLVGGKITWHGAHDIVLSVAKLDLDEAAPDRPIALSADATYDNTPFHISGTAGPLKRLLDTQATDPWPLKLSAQSEKATLDLDGIFSAPRRLGGYDLSVKATAADLGLIQPLVPVTLPALRDLRLAAHIAAGAPLPKVTELLLHAGASDLSAVLPGVTLTALDIAAPGPDQPLHATAAGSYANQPLALDLTAGAPAALLPGGPEAAFPLNLSAQMAGASLHIDGQLARPRAQAGLEARVTAEIPDVSAFAAVAGRRLPALRNMSLAAQLSDQDGLAHGISLHDLRLSLQHADLAGNLAVGFGTPPSVTGTLTGKLLDADALRAAWAESRPSAAPAPLGPAPAGPAPAPASPHRFVIPDTPFPLGGLHGADADLHLDLGQLTWRGVAYRSVAGHVVLQDGRLVIDPAAATMPAGATTGRLDIDIRTRPAQVALSLHAPGLAMKPLLSELGLPDEVDGTLQVEADLHGSGDSPHQVASGAGGYFGLAMVGGTVDGKLLSSTFGDLLRAVRLPGEHVGDGRSEVRCFALRLDADHGVAAVRAFYLSVSRLRVSGSGTVNLRDETLALRLRPFVEVAGTGLVVPLHVGGTLRKPVASVDPSGAPEAVAASAGRLAKEGSELTPITSAIAAAGEKLLGEADTGNCDPALAAARDGKPGPEPAKLKPDKGGAEDLLKRLFK